MKSRLTGRGGRPRRPSRDSLFSRRGPALLRSLGWGQLDRIRAVSVAERLGVDLLQLDLPRQHLLLPLLMRRDVGVELRQHLAREQLQALADVLVRVVA